MDVLQLIVPRRCCVCGRIGDALCAGCVQRLVRCVAPLCERCGAPGPWPVRRCAECSGRRLAFASARAALVYEAHARAFVSAWKERGRRDLAAVAARIVAESVPRPDGAVLTFVPGDRDRGLRRGHVPAASLSARLSERWGLPHQALLVRTPGIDRQRDLPRADRRRNVATAFTATGPVPRQVCLVDDVYTTGSTVTACATALRHEGAVRVSVVCLARAVR